MLFGKKKEASTNPYYAGSSTTPATPAQVTTPTMPQQAAVAQEMNQAAQQTSEGSSQFPVPLLPAPEPITLPNIEQAPLRLSTRMSALDIMKMGSETKSFAFVKLSDFKRILDDIKSLENKINNSQDELEEFSKLLKEQEDYLSRYSMVIKDLRRTIDEIASSLSRVED